MEAVEGQRTKLDEQATAKADLSYSYWAANAAKDAAPPPEAKKLTEEEAAKQAQHLQRAASSGASAWNAAGTFEERNLTSWAYEKVRELLVGAKGAPYGQGGVVATITEVVSCTGDACQWVVRGQTRANFDLDIKVKWTAAVDGKDLSGTARVPNAAWDELDELSIEVEVVGEAVGNSEISNAARSAAKEGLLPPVRAALEELISAIRQYGTS